jgi:hypothetical protein
LDFSGILWGFPDGLEMSLFAARPAQLTHRQTARCIFEDGKWQNGRQTPTVAPSLFLTLFVLKINFTFFCSFSIDVNVVEAFNSSSFYLSW